ncbi:MAG: hypothetical protein HWN80_12640, partial [Candidatus Lokiarchaeota archaeon]|nr:hypothetical protein [Candidatus Lokiarchaeota archaeon]
SGNYQIELWLRYSEFDGYGPFTIYFALNKTNYYNQTLQLDLSILGLTTSQINSPSQDQTYDSDEILTVILSYDDLVKGIPLDNALIQWKVGLSGTYSSTNVSYVSGNYQIELWLRYSEFDGYGPFTIYFALNKTNYYNQTELLNVNILGVMTSQIDSPAQNQTYDSDEIITIILSYDDSVKSISIDNALIQWKVGLSGTYSSTNVSYVSGNYQIELWLRYTEFEGYGPFTIYFKLNKTNYYNQTLQLGLNVLGLTTSQIDSPSQDQTYDSDEILTVILSYDDLVKGIPLDNALIQWKVGLSGTYSSTNVSYVSGNYQIELWLRDSEFDGYGPFTIYFMLNKTNYYNQTESLNVNILGLTSSQLESPAQDQTFDSDEIATIILSYDDLVKGIPIDNALIQWKVGLSGTYSSTNVSYVSGNYQIELWLRHSEFDGYGSFTIYFTLNKTNYYNQTLQLGLNILGVTNSQIDSPAQDQTFYSNETLIIVLSYDDLVKGIPIDNALIQWKVGLGGTYSSTNVSYVSGNYQIELWLRYTEFDGYGPFTIYFTLNKTNYYNQTTQLNFNILGLTTYNLLNLMQYDQQLQYNNGVYEAFQGENITLYMNFINLYPYKLISGAIGNVTFEGVSYLNYSDIDGLYSWEIDTSDLLPGSYSFFVKFNKTNYYNQSLLVFFDINIISTDITIESIFDDSGILDPYYVNGYTIYTSKGDSNVTFIITYWDVNHTYPIAGSLGNVTIKGEEFLVNTTLSNGNAWFTLNSSNYKQEVDFLINVTFWKVNYFQCTFCFNLTIVKYETNSSLIAVKQTGGLINSVYNGTHYIIYRNYNSTFLVEYWNEDDNIPIENAEVSFVLKMGLSTVYSDSSFTNISGQYEFYIPTHDFITGNYEFTITFSKEDYKTSIIYGKISIVLIPTNGSLLEVSQINHISGLPENLTYYSSNNTFIGLLSYNTTISFSFWDKLNEEWINSGATCLLFFDEIYYYNTSMVSNGIYSWVIPTYNKEGTFTIKIIMTKFNWANVSYQFNLTINYIPTSSQIDSPAQDQIYDSDEILNIILSFDDTLKGVPISGAIIQWKVGLAGTYSSTNISYVSGNYQIELWLRHSEFDGYGPFTIYLMLNKTYYLNHTLQLDFNILGLSTSQIDSPSQDQTYDSDEVITIILSYDDLVKSIPIDNALIQWKVGIAGTYSSTNISYVTGNYQIELWLRHSEFDGSGLFTIYFMLNKTNYYNQTESLNIYILRVTTSQIDLPAQDQTYDSDEIITIILSYDDSVKGIPIDSALIQWKIGLSGTYSNINVSYVSGNYQIELWLRYSEFDGYGPFIIYFTLNKTNYYNQTLQLNLNILGLTTPQLDSPSQDQTYDSDEIITIILSYDDLVKGIPIDNAQIQWKVGSTGTYSDTNVSYVSGNYQIELWLRHSEFDGYGPFTIYFALNKTNYYNQTLQLDLSILGLTTSQIDSPSQDQTFYSNETLIIVLSFDDYIKGIPIIDANIQWKVGLSGTYSSTNVSYVSGNYQIELWLRRSEFDGCGPFTIYFKLNKTNYYNQTEMLNINLIGLTSINIINITQYNQTLSLSGSIYECQTGENLTIYANFLSDYPNKTITGATGILTFNGDIYMSLENMEGVYEWEIDTSSLAFGLYNFNITFYKTYYENSTSLYEFRLNNLIAKIKCVQKPDSIRQGDSFYLNLKLYYTLFDEYPINNANISLMIDFGTSISYMDAFTNSSGITSYKVVVPRNANRIVITAYYSGNGTYTSASLEITDIELIPVEKGTFPFELLLIIIIGGAIAIGLSGVFIIRKKSKKKSLKAKGQAPVEPKSEKVSKAKIVEHSKPEAVEDTEIVSPETPTPILKEEAKGKIPEESEPISKEEMNGKATKSLTPNSSEKKKAKKEKNVKKNKKAKKTKKTKKSNNENAK